MAIPNIPDHIVSLLAQLPVPLVLTSGADSLVRYTNPIFPEQFNVPPGAYLGQPLQSFLTVETSGFEKLNSQLPLKQKGILRFSASEPIPVLVSQKLLALPENADYQLWVIERPDQDETLAKAHHDFLSTVSHEFRTPLTSIKGFADTLLKYGGQLDEEQQRRFVHIIRDQADRLIRMVEALLDVSKNGEQKLEMLYRPVLLKPLLERIVQSVIIKNDSGKTKSQTPIVIDVPGNLPPLWVDSDRLEQILTNLVDNAVKYSLTDKTVMVKAYESCASLPVENNAAPIEAVAIDVVDEGIGISKEHLEKLFTRFYRVECPLTQQVEGTGLGLYITKSLTKAMGGDISVQSELGKGSTFHVVFPVATLEKQAAYHRSRCSEEAVNQGEEPFYAE